MIGGRRGAEGAAGDETAPLEVHGLQNASFLQVNRYAVGIDVGGTKIAAGIVDSAGTILACRQTRAHSEREPAVVIAAIEEAFRSLLECDQVTLHDLEGVGVGFPGTINLPRGSILISSNLPAWDRVPLRDILAERLGLPVVLDNDAHMCAVGEHRFGAGRGVRNMCYVCFSTGFGLGAIVENRLVTGHTGSAGELSHVVIEPGGRPCTCGKRGCLMAYASGIAIARRVSERIAAGEETVLCGMAPCNGRRITGEQVAAAAAQGDRVAREVLQHAGYYFGLGMAMLVQLFNPELIVIGGGLTHIGPLLMDEAARGLKESVQPELRDTVRLAPWQLGDNIGIIGAAAEVFETLET
jgi:glucokinase